MVLDVIVILTVAVTIICIFVCICCHVHPKVDLSSNLVLLCIKDKVALAKTPRHPADILDTVPILLPVFIGLDELILHIYKDFHLLGIGVVLVIIELHGIGMLDIPLLVLTLLHLIFQGSFFPLFFPAVSVFVKRLLYFRDQSGLDQLKVLVDNQLNVLDSSDQEVLVSNTVLNTDAESVQGLQK